MVVVSARELGRDRSFLYYALHIGCLALAFFGFHGLGQEYLWPTAPWLRAAPMWLLAASFGLGALFVRWFLMTREETPIPDRALAAVPVVAAAGILVSPLGWALATAIEAVAALGFVAASLVAGTLRLRQGYRPAGYFLGGQAVFLLSIPLSLAADFLAARFGILTSVLVPAAAAVGAVLLSLGLADRLRALQAERDRLVPALTERTEELERFAHTVSHDLRSPLVTIKGFLPLVEKDAAAGDLLRLRHDLERHHSRIFGLFEQLIPNSSGTGYGLAHVKRLVEQEGGRVWVESAGRGRGSTFYFTLGDRGS